MKQNFTSINIVIDSSGSMHGLRHDTIGNFNSFLKDQKEFPGEATFTLCTFNNEYTIIHDFIKINDVPDLDIKNYNPMGGTALLDAIGFTMDSVGKKLSDMKKDDRPSKVLFVVITDGQENSSRSYTVDKIKTMVSHQKDVYNWEFMFFGASIDQIAAGTNLGVARSMGYIPTAAGVKDLYRSISTNSISYRSK